MTSRSESFRRGSARNRALFFLAVVANLSLLYWPHAPSPGGIPHLDKVVHVATFASVAWTASLVGFSPRWVLPVLVAHALASELVQEALLPERGGDAADVAADGTGVALGLLGGTWRHERAADGRRTGGAAARREPGAR